MANDSKFFVQSFFISSFLIFSFIFFVNYWYDPAGIFSSGTSKVETRIAEYILENGSLHVPLRNYDERAMKVALIEHLKSNPETVIIGSSTARLIGENTGVSNALNLSITGAGLEEPFALLLLALDKFSPKKIIIGLDPGQLTNLGVDSVKKNESIKKRVDYIRSNYGIQSNQSESVNTGILTQLVNGAYFIDSAKLLIFDLVTRVSGFRPCYDLYNNFCLFADGSASEQKRRLKKIKLSDKTPSLPVGWSEDNIHFLSAVIKDMSQRKIEVILFLPPVSPEVYLESGMIGRFDLLMNRLESLAVENDIRILGSYNPISFGCAEIDFLDETHASTACIKRIFSEEIHAS